MTGTGGEDFPEPELDLPGPEALQTGFRAIIEECVQNTVTSRTLRRETQGISDDRTRQKLRQAEAYEGEVTTLAKFFDRFLPNPGGGRWMDEIGRRADILEEERFESGEA